jgi:hypothetical protein
MSCCGKISGTANRASNFRAAASVPGANTPPLNSYFRCTGPSAITAIGAATGKAYRFPPSGQIVAVDGRDAISLSRVPHLQAVRPR